MLAGCSSSTLLSPRHRGLRSESQLQASCHFQIPSSMNTQRLDLPCSFPSSRPTPVVSLPGGERAGQAEGGGAASMMVAVSSRPPTPTAATSCSLKQSIKLPPSPAAVQRGEINRGNHHHQHRQFWVGELEEDDVEEGGRQRRRGGAGGNNKKRRAAADHSFMDDIKRVKRKKGGGGGGGGFVLEDDDGLSILSQLGSSVGGGSLWFQEHQEDGFEVGSGHPPPFSITTCSGGGEETETTATSICCFIPGRNHHPWIDPEEIADFEQRDYEEDDDDDDDGNENDVKATTDPQREPSGSNSSSSDEDYTFTLGGGGGGVRIYEQTAINQGQGQGPGHGYGNGSRSTMGGVGSMTATTPMAAAAASSTVQNEQWEEREEERRGFELVSLLIGCVESISTRNIPAVNHYIARLGEIASPRGRSPINRLVAYFTEALALRVTRVWPHLFHIALPREVERADEETATALRLLNQISPIPKFIHYTANEMILRAFEGKDRVHVIDLDIKQGLQWPALFQSLASRRDPPSHVRITGVGESKQELVETGERLAGFAEALNLPFKFHPVVDRLEDVRLWMLHVKEGESVAVNCVSQVHKVLYDAASSSRGAFRDLMGLIRSTNPAAVVVAEQEAEHNEVSLEKRVCNSLRYYGAVFDSIGSSGLTLDSPARAKVEEMFAREIRNIVACEGVDRFERHEGFGKWRRRMMMTTMEEHDDEHGGGGGGGGFRCLGVTDREFMQSRMLLRMHGLEEFEVEKRRVVEDDDNNNNGGLGLAGGGGGEALTLSWLDQPLFTVSAWKII